MEHWFHGDGSATPADRQSLEEKALALGIDLSQLPLEDPAPSLCEVWPEHWQAVEVFLAGQTQWRASSGGVVGLDYVVILQLCELYDVTDRKQLLADIQVMEIRARELINKAAE